MNKTRLLKLAKHLEKGKLGHEIFDFNCFNANYGGDEQEYSEIGCGTRGCAIGEMPILDSKNWTFDPVYKLPVLISKKDEASSIFTACYRSAAEYFGITEIEAHFLFNADDADLKSDATKEDVAEHIRNFINNEGIY